MKRLTKRVGSNVVACTFDMDFVLDMSEKEYAEFMNLMEKLADYEDAEEEGRLVILPCKVGDTVYLIRNNTSACKSCPDFSHFYGMDSTCCINDIYYPEIEESPICEKQFFEIAKYTPSAYWIFEYGKKFGKTVFLTREEAESALEKMKGEQHE